MLNGTSMTLKCSIAGHRAERPSDCIGFAVLDVQLDLNIVEVPLERALRDEDSFGDFLVAEARLQALEDRDLAVGELFAQAGPGGASLIAGLAPAGRHPRKPCVGHAPRQSAAVGSKADKCHRCRSVKKDVQSSAGRVKGRSGTKFIR